MAQTEEPGTDASGDAPSTDDAGERRPTGDVRPDAQPGICLNCEAVLHGPFCSSCGQRASELNQPLREVLGDWIAQITAFDSKILRTIGPLLLKPGWLTLQYFAGRRACYVPPLKLYLFLSLVTFLAIGLTNQNIIRVSGSAGGQESATGESSAAAGSSESEKIVAPVELDARTGGKTDGPPPPWVQRLEQALQEAAEDPQELSSRFFAQLPKALFLLVPVFALLLRVFFRRSPHRYVRHLVLSLHLHSLCFLLMTSSMVLDYLSGTEVASDAMQPAVWVYLFLYLRRVFGQGIVKTFLKTVLLMISYWLAILVAMILILLLLLL